MINLLNVLLITSYNALYGNGDAKSNVTSGLANLASETLHNAASFGNPCSHAIFDNKAVIDWSETDLSSSYAEIHSFSTNYLTNPTSSTKLEGFDHFGLFPNPSMNSFIQPFTTTLTESKSTDSSIGTFSIDEELIEEDEDDLEKRESSAAPSSKIEPRVGKTKDNEDPKECILTTYIAPQHGFVNLECTTNIKHTPSSVSEVLGFYPISDSNIEIAAGLVMGHTIGREFDVGGYVADDEEYYNRCETGELACAKADFAISRDQVETALQFIGGFKDACESGDASKCSYNLSERNCVDFVDKVAKVAGVKEDIFTKLKVTATSKAPVLKQKLFSMADKAWKYIYLKTWGQVNLSEERNV